VGDDETVAFHLGTLQIATRCNDGELEIWKASSELETEPDVQRDLTEMYDLFPAIAPTGTKVKLKHVADSDSAQNEERAMNQKAPILDLFEMDEDEIAFRKRKARYDALRNEMQGNTRQKPMTGQESAVWEKQESATETKLEPPPPPPGPDNLSFPAEGSGKPKPSSEPADNPFGQSDDQTVGDFIAQLEREEAILRAFRYVQLSAFAFSPDGQRFAAGTEAGTLHIWDTTTGERVMTLHHNEDLPPVGDPRGWSVTRLIYSPDGQTIVTGYGDGKLRIWDVTER
jgi:WD40 repeat protein